VTCLPCPPYTEINPILIADHSAADRRLATAALEAAGHPVRTAPDADTALRLLEAWTPRLIVLDLDLPDIDGVALTAMLRWRDHLRGIPVVAIAAPGSPHAHELHEIGFDAVLPKPVEGPELVRRIGLILGRALAVA